MDLKSTHPYEDHSDADLVQRWLIGNEAAFDALYTRYATRLLNTAVHKTGSKEISRELVQEVFMELYLHRFSIDTNARLEGYLFTILNNKISNYHRRLLVEQKYREHTRLVNRSTEAGADQTTEKKELKKKIDSVIYQLPPRCRAVFLLKRNEQLSNKEISMRLKISENTVEQHMRKARNLLRRSLEDYE
jgi:RNA polymerase sigma-70 factor (family 1)